ncbi:D-glycero-beta-D-manno-heptose 1,7-bisphosphate 7-phosphatase [Lentisalinibacter sediminis]|uniref:D-glycero-beta-D-manno-heptose 1,7-bisphosphate 7-phosphatase n=1 Tax=Lentisalinibacter sediminis TaxID=2992237 RepID=UPI0038633B71
MKLVVLDRDGTINRDSAAYIKSPDEWTPLPGSAEAIARLNRAGFTVAVASNQSGLARGLFDEATLAKIHAKMHAVVGAAGGEIDRVVWCPHHPDAGCDCRKPRPGLLHRLATDYGIGLEGVPVVGDSARDLEAARAVGARPVLVRTGNGRRTEAEGTAGDAEVYDDLAAAAAALTGER